MESSPRALKRAGEGAVQRARETQPPRPLPDRLSGRADHLHEPTVKLNVKLA
jgi:hypothetical protein